MPISHHRCFSDYIAKQIGLYGTLGLIEDTSALNDGVLDEKAFLKQAGDIYKESIVCNEAACEGAIAALTHAEKEIERLIRTIQKACDFLDIECPYIAMDMLEEAVVKTQKQLTKGKADE